MYTGFGLIKSALEQRPDNFLMYLAIGAVFVAIGGFFVVKSGLKLKNGDYEK